MVMLCDALIMQLLNPTKRNLINFLESLPVADDSVLNVSINQQDIRKSEQVTFTVSPDEKEFCLDFAI